VKNIIDLFDELGMGVAFPLVRAKCFSSIMVVEKRESKGKRLWKRERVREREEGGGL
jgi:hypothetical protein